MTTIEATVGGPMQIEHDPVLAWSAAGIVRLFQRPDG
jgi:hypothetical protein